MSEKSDDVVISGIAGRFPKSRNLKEFSENLFKKVDMTDDSEVLWKHILENIPKRSGKITDLDKFDAKFFSMMNNQANLTDPQLRILFEHVYEAILDAGISPQSLIESNTGVIIGCSMSESMFTYTKGSSVAESGAATYNNGPFFLASKISYTFGFRGPALIIDTACSSAASALNCALKYIKQNECDAAIVAGSHLNLGPRMFIEFSGLGALTPDGISKVFDEDSKGFVRSDAIAAVFLQKRKDAKRIYAQLVHSLSNNDGFKHEGILLPSKEVQQLLMERLYKEVNIDPSEINYFEAHATGTKLGDFQEIGAVDEVFCKKNRQNNLIVGSVKSNLGHAEAASAMPSLAKILIAFESGKIPPNINLNKLREDIPAFAEGRIEVATDAVPLTSEYISMNSFGFGGYNVHLLFKRNSKQKIITNIGNIERMVLWSGRTEDAVHAIFDDIISRPLDIEYIALLQNTQTITPNLNCYRGFGIFKNNEENTICIERNVQSFDGIRRQIVFSYAGMGSQWHKMGQDLMAIELFTESIEKCHEILLENQINLKSILNSNDEKIYENVLNAYVGIISIQIALTDVLYALNVKPDWIVGHSVGEIACAYADGCLTMKEALNIAYLRAKLTLDLNINGGAMAVVGMSSEELEKILSYDIDIACYNAKELITISGNKKVISEFVDQLKSQNIFAKEIECAGVPFHSRHMTVMAKKFEEKLQDLLKTPKMRSNKWITSTYNEENEQNKICNIKYQTDNVTNSVYFDKAIENLPKNSLIIEISPHGLLKTFFKLSSNESIYERLMNKNSKNHKDFFMQSLGKIFQHGVDLDISKLYPAIKFPVSRGTSMISPLIKWNHEHNYFVPMFDHDFEFSRFSKIFNFNSPEYSYVYDHVIDGKAIIPAMFWIHSIWKYFAAFCERKWYETKITLTKVECVQLAYPDKEVKITLLMNRKTGNVEIYCGNNLIMKAIAKCDDNVQIDEIEDSKYSDDDVVLTKDDFYKFVHIHGYHYKEGFQLVHEITNTGLKGKIKWNNNWATFADTLFQMLLIKMTSLNQIGLPRKIEKISFDPILHNKILERAKLNNKQNNQSEILLPIEGRYDLGTIRCGGVEMYEPLPIAINRQEQKNLTHEFYKFISFENDERKFEFSDALKIFSTTIIDRNPKQTYNLIEINDESSDFWAPMLEINSRSMQNVLNIKVLTKTDQKINNVEVITDKDISIFNNIDAIYARYKLNEFEFINKISKVLCKDGILITLEESKVEKCNEKIEILSKLTLKSNQSLIMARMKTEEILLKPVIFKITSNLPEWFENLKQNILNFSKNSNQTVLLYSQEPYVGLLGFYNCLRLEFPEINISCFIIDDTNAPEFDIENSFYKKQFLRGFKKNILKNNQWGTFYHLNMNITCEPVSYKEQCFANYSRRGNLNTIKWHQGPMTVLDNPQNNCDLIKVQYVALNFKDIVYAFGYIPDGVNLIKECSLGLEFGGIRVKTGERVFVLTRNTAGITSYFDTSDKENTIVKKIDDELELIDMTSSLLVYFTVYYSFFYTTKIEKGKSILIHSGAGGVGQAALHTAFNNDLEVFVTVGTEEKRKFLLENFSKLKPENIGNSRDTSFYKMVMTQTNGRGVDYVLNSLSGDKMIASLDCVAKNGCFLEIGQADIMLGTQISLKFLERNISIKSVRADLIDFSIIPEKIFSDILEDFKKGKIKPPSRTVFDANDVVKAFQHMSTGNHIGKIILKIRENLNDEETLPISVTPRFYCNPERSYIIVGGLNGLGFEFSEWLVGRKCRKIIFNSRRGITNQYQIFKINYWKSFGVEVIVNTSDATTEAGCKELIKIANDHGVVDGIFNFAAIIKDGFFSNQTLEAFNQTLAPKAIITKYLHELSLKLCPQLKHFIVYSSVSCGIGMPGQTNYGMANSIMEEIILKRYEMGLPAKALQWGAIADVGILANMGNAEGTKYNFKFSVQSLASFLECHDLLLLHPEPIVTCATFNQHKSLKEGKQRFTEVLMDFFNIEDRSSFSLNSTFSQLGVDSLGGIEIQNMIEREFGVSFTVQELRSMTLGEIDEKIEKKRND
ncbi:hypothetical protein PVAND_008554 [Polypedilum vanderplanki]|uniref:Uncharacterized protein n=1 Tax=Polypedilum vanderplanki TaxID=319348 RepID=A0A9J6CAB9_POLVA|nr:hypothetical protein PVAND_008554 [Polypedilum vanderplanki]